jgi:hypothetical protein
MTRLSWASEIEEFETLQEARDRVVELFGASLYEETLGNITNFYIDTFDGTNPAAATIEVL